MPVSKQTRKSRHEQAENPTLQRGNPASSEGRVGTQQFRNRAGKGLVHMVRSETGWKEMGSSQSSTNQGDKVESTVPVPPVTINFFFNGKYPISELEVIKVCHSVSNILPSVKLFTFSPSYKKHPFSFTQAIPTSVTVLQLGCWIPFP